MLSYRLQRDLRVPAMTKFDSIVFAQLPAIRQIVFNETWLEAERRGCSVNVDDCVVRENVCLVVLRIGALLRESAERMMEGARCSGDSYEDAPEAAMAALDFRVAMAESGAAPAAGRLL